MYGQAGYIQTLYSYTPDGCVSSTGAVIQPIQWSSEMYEDELALVYYNYRYYNAHDGRWISRDSLSSLNPYDFCLVPNIFDLLGEASSEDTKPIEWTGILGTLSGTLSITQKQGHETRTISAKNFTPTGNITHSVKSQESTTSASLTLNYSLSENSTEPLFSTLIGCEEATPTSLLTLSMTSHVNFQMKNEQISHAETGKAILSLMNIPELEAKLEFPFPSVQGEQGVRELRAICEAKFPTFHIPRVGVPTSVSLTGTQTIPIRNSSNNMQANFGASATMPIGSYTLKINGSCNSRNHKSCEASISISRSW